MTQWSLRFAKDAKQAASGKKTRNQKLRTASLASGLVAAASGYGQAEVLVGIDWSVVDADFVVEMGTGGASAHADIADGIATMDLLSRRDGEARQVSIAGGDGVAMVDHDGFAISAKEVGELWGKFMSKDFTNNPHDFVAEGDKVIALTTVKLEGESIEGADVLTYNGEGKLVAFDTLGDEAVPNRVFAK